jgi:hypothetical protein
MLFVPPPGGGTEMNMYLHLGQDVVVKLSAVVGIFDIENTSHSRITRRFLENAEKSGQIININSGELPKSYAVCEEDGKTSVYISQISAATLLKRCRGSYDWPDSEA